MGTGFFRGRCAFGKFNADTVIFEYKAVLRPVVQLSAGQDNGIAAADYIAGDFAIDAGAAVNDRCAQSVSQPPLVKTVVCQRGVPLASVVFE